MPSLSATARQWRTLRQLKIIGSRATRSPSSLALRTATWKLGCSRRVFVMTVRYWASQCRHRASDAFPLAKASTPAEAPVWLPRPPQTHATSWVPFLNSGKSAAPGSRHANVSLSR